MAVKEELQQDSDLFKLLSTHHEKYSELLGLEEHRTEGAWFDDLDQVVFNFKHKIHSWLRDSADKSSSEASSKGSGICNKSSRSTKSSSSPKSSIKRKLLEKKANVAELEAEATFLLEKQKAENQPEICKFNERLQKPKQGLECMKITTRWKSILK